MKGMTIIVKKITQIMIGFIFLYGFYIILQGHLSPGGGFGGGAILAGAFILLVIAFGADAKLLKSKEARASLFEALGILLFIIMAMGALLLGYKTGFLPVFFKNFLDKGIAGNLVSGRCPVCHFPGVFH
jgi:multicomponent Na+:H+ antiporter subunit B